MLVQFSLYLRYVLLSAYLLLFLCFVLEDKLFLRLSELGILTLEMVLHTLELALEMQVHLLLLFLYLSQLFQCL